jgi:hypothetical protein
MAVNTDQQAFRIRTDATAAQGGTPVWLAAQNAVATPPNGVAFRIRFALANTGATSTASITYQLFVSKNAGAYALIPSSVGANPVYSTDATAGASADNSAISSSLLTGASGVFQNGQYDFTGATSAFILTTGDYTEIEFGIEFQSLQIANGDTYAFRIYPNGSVANTYTQTPTLTIVSTTFARDTQVSVEQFGVVNPFAQVTQVSAEQFGTGAAAAQVTQVALEEWATVAGGAPTLLSGSGAAMSRGRAVIATAVPAIMLAARGQALSFGAAVAAIGAGLSGRGRAQTSGLGGLFGAGFATLAGRGKAISSGLGLLLSPFNGKLFASGFARTAAQGLLLAFRLPTAEPSTAVASDTPLVRARAFDHEGTRITSPDLVQATAEDNALVTAVASDSAFIVSAASDYA